MIRNSIYTGCMVRAGVPYPDYCPAIVSQDLFDRCQQVAEYNAAHHLDLLRHPRRIMSGYLLSGLVRCTLCGRLMVGNSAGHGRSRFYRCSNSMAAIRTCKAAGILCSRLDGAVINRAREYLTSPAVMARLFAEAEAQAAGAGETYQARRAALDRDIDDVLQQVNRITAAIAAAGHSPALLQSLAGLEARQAELTVERSRLAPPARRALVDPGEYAERSRLAWAAFDQAPLRDRQVFLRALVDHIDAVSYGAQGRRTIEGEIVLRALPGLEDRQPIVLPL